MAASSLSLNGLTLKPSSYEAAPIHIRTFKRAANGKGRLFKHGPDKQLYTLTWDGLEEAALLDLDALLDGRALTFVDIRGTSHAVAVQEGGYKYSFAYYEASTMAAMFDVDLVLEEL